MTSSFSLSFSSYLLPSPIPQTKFNCKFSVTSRSSSIKCASSATSSSSTATKTKKKKHWKEGEYPGVSETTIPSRFNNNNKTPIKNIKKKLDRKYEARSWANTVTEALSDCIDKKQWLQALKVQFVLGVLLYECFEFSGANNIQSKLFVILLPCLHC